MQHFSMKPDFDTVYARYEAFWNRAVLDRAPVSIALPQPDAQPLARKKHESYEAYWFDYEYRGEMLVHQIENTRYLYDALPIACPNFGPDVFSVWCGCGLEYDDRTPWAVPCIGDWELDHDRMAFRAQNRMFQATLDYTRWLLDRGRGRFIVGLTDFHPGADHLAALRDPRELAFDLTDCPQYVRQALAESYPVFQQVYNIFYEMLRAEEMPITSWLPLVNERSYNISRCDFSYLIGNDVFERFFLEGIAEECRFYDRSVYHLEGPQALRHLDSVLEIPELDAVHWACGEGNEGFHRWVEVYKDIQAAKKGVVLCVHAKELPMVFEALKPEGVFFRGIDGVSSEEEAAEVVKRIERWSW